MRSLLCVGLLALAAGAVWSQAADVDHAEAVKLVKEARSLSADKDYTGAEGLLKQAIALDPDYPDAYANLGYVYEMLSRREEALDQYGHCLSLAPERQYTRRYATRAFQMMFFEGRFPRWIRLPYIKFSPLSLVTDTSNVEQGGERLTTRFAYTTSLLFPEEMTRDEPAVIVKIPAAGGTGLAGQCIANRVCYGFILRPDSDVADLRIALYYPSVTVSRSGTDYSALAPRLMHMLLRTACYTEAYLGRPVPKAGDELLKVYMAELGPTGAEMWQDSIYLYDVDTQRAPEEWTRQVAHELGHYLLPPVGRFTAPEALANGVLGERLGMQWLASEAELVSGHRWPDEQAQAVLGQLWGADSLDLASYISESCLGDVAFWLQKGPDSLLLGGVGPDSFRYYVGFCLWVQVAHGQQLLRAVLDMAEGNQPGDFVYAYKEEIARLLADGELYISAAGCNLPASKLSQPPLDGATGWRAIKLAGGDTLVFTIYLPEGEWALSVDSAQAIDDLQVAVNEATPVALSDVHVVQTESGWHLVRLSRPGAGSGVLIRGLKVRQAAAPM